MNQSNKEKVQSMFAALAGGDLETLKSYLHPDVVVKEADCLPFAGVYRGPEGYLELVQKVTGTWVDPDFSVKAMLGEGDLVVVVSELTAKKQSRHFFYNADDRGVLLYRWQGERGAAVLLRHAQAGRT